MWETNLWPDRLPPSSQNSTSMTEAVLNLKALVPK